MNSRRNFHRLILPAVLCCGLLTLPACVTTKARKPTQESTAPFAEQTVAMLGELQFGMQRANIILLQQYIEDSDSPRVDAYSKAWDEVTVVLRAIVAYSIQVVDLVDRSGKGNGDGAARLAGFIDNLYGILRTQPRASAYLEGVAVEELITAVRTQETLQEGLEAAEPAIETVVSIVSRMLLELRDKVELATGEINEKILAEHTAVLEYRAYLRSRQSEIINVLRRVDQARLGEAGAPAGLLAESPLLQARFSSLADTGPAGLERLEAGLIERLAEIDMLRQRIEPDFRLFQEQQKELRNVKDVAFDGLRRAQISVVLWSRAHRAFATGESNQFGVTDVTGMLLKYAL